MAKLAAGKLLILVNDPDALIFVNEVGLGRGGTFSANMIPGPYRIVIISRGESRRYDVAVDPGNELKLDLDWEIETALRVSDDSVALALSYEPDQRRMEEIARRLRERARSANAPDGERVILIGIEQACGHTIVSGMHYPDLPRVLIGHVVMGRGQRPSPASRAREVRPAGRGVIKVQRRRRRDQARARRRAAVELHDGSFSLVLPLLLGGAVALAGGMTWHYIAAAHPADPVAELSLSNPRVQSLVIAGTGGYLLGAGVVAWARRRHGMRALPAITMAACIGTVLAGSVLFATDQDPSGKTLYYQDSGTPRLIVGAVGVSCLGAAYLLSRADPPPSVPVVSLSPGHVSLGWGRARVRTYQPTARPAPRRCNRGPVKLRDVAAGDWNFRLFSHVEDQKGIVFANGAASASQARRVRRGEAPEARRSAPILVRSEPCPRVVGAL